MPLRVRTRATWSLAVLTLLAPAALQAQDSLVSDVTASFAGFPWGSTAEQITAGRGTPARDTVERDYRRLVYHDTVDAKPVEIWYRLHPTRGLMAGQVSFPKPKDTCVDEFKRIRKVVERANSRLRKRDELKRDIPIVCLADAGPRLGSWLLYWGDSGSTQISQMMITGSAYILVTYKGPGADAYAEERRANRGPAMQTFATFAWGVTRDSIVKRLGAPKAVDSTGGVYKLSYFDLLIGERALVEFTVSPVEGLMSGIYWVPLPAGRDCEVFFRKFHFALVERFIDIKPEIARRNPRYGGFCAGVVEGTASLTAVWRDPKSEASVTSELQKPGKYVRIAYVGPPYVTWFQRTRSADVKSKF